MRVSFPKWILPQSLLGRSLIILVSPLILVQMILSYVFFDRHTEAILHLSARSIAGDVLTLAELMNEAPLSRVQVLAKNLEMDLSLDTGGHLSSERVHRDRWLFPFMAEALDTQLPFPYFLKIDNHTIFIEVMHPKGILHMTSPRKRLYSKTTQLVLLWTTLSAVLLLIISSLFMRNQIRPIMRLSQWADEFGKGTDNGPLPLEGATDVRQAGKAYNLMRERINRQLTDRLEMLAGVSHDLKTPLTRMTLCLAMMPQDENVQTLKEEVEAMGRMVQGFLEFARGAEEAESSQVVYLKGFCDALVQDLSHLSLRIQLEIPDTLSLPLKPLAFNRVLTNLLLNSQRYATEVTLTASQKGKEILLFVDDNGPGIEEAYRAHVFKPFARIDESRNAETGGVGLGLSIVKNVIIRHGGDIGLDTSPAQGLRVKITLPC